MCWSSLGFGKSISAATVPNEAIKTFDFCTARKTKKKIEKGRKGTLNKNLFDSQNEKYIKKNI